MTKRLKFGTVDRRTIVKAGAVVGLSQIAKPFVWSARAADAIKIGMVDPFTGVYAAVAQNELIGVKYAVEQINAKGGVLGRPVGAAGRGLQPTTSAPACRRRAS